MRSITREFKTTNDRTSELDHVSMRVKNILRIRSCPRTIINTSYIITTNLSIETVKCIGPYFSQETIVVAKLNERTIRMKQINTNRLRRHKNFRPNIFYVID